MEKIKRKEKLKEISVVSFVVVAIAIGCYIGNYLLTNFSQKQREVKKMNFKMKVQMKLRKLQFHITELRLYLFNSEYRKELLNNNENIFTK